MSRVLDVMKMAIKFEKITPGMALFDVRKAGARSMSRRKWEHYRVSVLEVDTVNRKVLASWNGNSPEWMGESRVIQYRAKLPKD